MAPGNGSSLYVEMDHTTRYSDPVVALKAALPGLMEMGVLSSPNDVRVARLRTIPNAYAVPDRHYESSLAKIFEYCSHHDMYLLGRFGRWNYSSMGEDMIRAARLARECM